MFNLILHSWHWRSFPRIVHQFADPPDHYELPQSCHTSGYCPLVASSLATDRSRADGPCWVPAMAFSRTHVSSHHCSPFPHNGIMTRGMPTLDQTPAPGSHTASLSSLRHSRVTSHSTQLHVSYRNVRGQNCQPFPLIRYVNVPCFKYEQSYTHNNCLSSQFFSSPMWMLMWEFVTNIFVEDCGWKILLRWCAASVWPGSDDSDGLYCPGQWIVCNPRHEGMMLSINFPAIVHKLSHSFCVQCSVQGPLFPLRLDKV